MAERYPGQRSEYGGGDGLIQRTPDGESIDLPGVAASTGDRAMLMRKAGAADFDPARDDLVGAALTARDRANMSEAELEAYESDLRVSAARAAERQRLMDETNGYIAEGSMYVGESGEMNGVTGDMAEGNAAP